MNAPKVRLGDLGRMIRGSGIRRNETVPEGLPCIRYGEIYTSYNVVLDRPRSFVPPSLYEKCPRIKKGDLVLALTGENKEEIAKSLAYLGEEEVAAGGDTAVWTGHGCDPLYLAYMMYSPKMIKAKADASNGHIVVHASVKKLQQIEVSLPPLSEQRKIAASVDKAMKRVDAIERQFEKLKDAIERHYVASKNTIVCRLKHRAEIKTLEEICDLITDGTHQTPTYAPKGEGAYKFLSSKDVVSKVIDWRNVKYIPESLHNKLYERLAPQKGDILLAKNGTTGVAAIVDCDEVFDIYVSLALLRPKKGVNARYLWHLINTPDTKQQFNKRLKGSGVPNLHLTEIRAVHVPFPESVVQEEVVAAFDELDQRHQRLECVAARGLANCARMRKAILAEAFAV